MPLTLKDIAEMVGVAESTVSRAINNKPGVGEQTRKQIMEIVREYDFTPNKLAQGLAKQETHIIALFIPDLSTPQYSRIIRSVEAVANQQGYQLILCNTDNDLEKEKTYLNLLEKNQVDGAIIVGGDLVDKNIVNTILRGDNIIVLINRLAEEVLIPTVLIDSEQGAYMATEHLLKQGIDRIALIMGEARDYQENEKFAGYQQALADRGLPLNRELIVDTNGQRDDGYQAFLELMELSDPPRGFFVTRDLLAAGLVEAIKMGGYLIPNDFAVIAYGESVITSVLEPGLSVVAEPLDELGEKAAENLIKLINDRQPESMIQVFEPVLKVRESSKFNLN